MDHETLRGAGTITTLNNHPCSPINLPQEIARAPTKLLRLTGGYMLHFACMINRWLQYIITGLAIWQITAVVAS